MEKSIEHAAKIKHSFSKKNKKLTLYKLKQKMYDSVAEENYGVTHYGCSPEDFLLSEFWPDCFCLDCVITKSLMTRLQKMVLGANLEFQEAFHF